MTNTLSSNQMKTHQLFKQPIKRSHFMLETMPQWNQMFKEILFYYQDGIPHNNKQAKIDIVDGLNLTPELRSEVTPKHKENRIEGRVGWGISALKIAGLLEKHQHGYYIITKQGLNLINQLPNLLDERYLIEHYPTYKERVIRNKNKDNNNTSNQLIELSDNINPLELLENAGATLDSNLKNELLAKLYEVDPYRFEYICAHLLDKMGYGDLEVTQQSNDGDIDAVVNEDKLGLDKIFVQAKRYKEGNKINSKAISDFLGSLSANSVVKGIFITTSSFDSKCREIIKKSDKKIRLIDGQELASLMIDYNVGTSIKSTYYVKDIDNDYFE